VPLKVKYLRNYPELFPAWKRDVQGPMGILSLLLTPDRFPSFTPYHSHRTRAVLFNTFYCGTETRNACEFIPFLVSPQMAVLTPCSPSRQTLRAQAASTGMPVDAPFRDGNGSVGYGSPFLDGSHGSWVTAIDP